MLRECWSAERVDARGSVSERGFVSQGHYKYTLDYLKFCSCSCSCYCSLTPAVEDSLRISSNSQVPTRRRL
jgi:hypothetical protein